MQVITKFSGLIIGMLLSVVAQAQQQWSLQQCIDRALKENLQIKQSELNLRLEEINQTQSFADLFPTVNASVSHNYYFGRNIDPVTNIYTTDQVQSNNFSLSSSLIIFRGLQIQNTIKQSKINHRVAWYDLETIKNDIALAVAAAYLQVLFADELITVSEQQLLATQEQRNRTKNLVEAGSLPKGSLLDVEAQLASEEVQLVNSQNNYEISLLNLAQLMEMPSVEGFSVVAPQIEVPATPTDLGNASSIFATAQTILPQILAEDTRVLGSEKGLDIAKGARYPRLSLIAGIGTSYSSAYRRFENFQLLEVPFQDQVEQNYNQSIGFNLSIPIFNNLSVSSGIKRAKIALMSAQNSAGIARNNLLKNIQQSYADAIAANKRLTATEKSVAALEQSFNYTQQRFDVGVSVSYDYTIAKNNLARARSEYLQAKYDYIFKIKVLEFYQGKPLTL